MNVKKYTRTLLKIFIVFAVVFALAVSLFQLIPPEESPTILAHTPAETALISGDLYCGKNLLNLNAVDFDKSVKILNNVFYYSGSYIYDTSRLQFNNIPAFSVGKTYTLSYTVNNINDKSISLSSGYDMLSSTWTSIVSIPAKTTKEFIYTFEARAFNRLNIIAFSSSNVNFSVTNIMLEENSTATPYEPYIQNYSGTVFPLNVVDKRNPYTAMIGYYALPRPLPSNINVSFFVEGIDGFELNKEESPRYNIGFTRTGSLEYVFDNNFVNDADFYTEIPLSSLSTRIIDDQLINVYQCFDMTYIVLDFSSGDKNDVWRIQRAVVEGDIKGYIRVHSMNADYSGAYNSGYGTGLNDGYYIKQNDSLAIFPSFFGAIADFFKKFSSIELFGITLGTVVATIVIIGVTISLYKMFR